VDDEPMAHIVLKKHIEKFDQLDLVAQFFNIPNAQKYLQQNKVDLLFLDIHMPEVTGIDFLKSEISPPQTILTSAYSDYALESYEYGVLDYLLKPISSTRFDKSINRFLSIYSSEKEYEPQMITLRVDGENIDILESDIQFIQSYGNYVRVYLNHRFYLASTTTHEILSNLSPKIFIRIHKSYIVNLTKISNYSEKEVKISDNILPVGITFMRDFINRVQL
jgi:Response regulator of the LytR/AlgR family